MKKILVTNDDGIRSPALNLLADKLSPLGKVTVVAPETPMNAMGNSLSLHKPVRIIKYSPSKFSVTGTPADCSRIGVLNIMKENADLVVSGINDGANLGDDVSYSGTVAGAREAALLGVPAISVSLVTGPERNFASAADIAVKVASRVLKKGMPERKLFNINVPDLPSGEVKGIKVARLGVRIYDRRVREREDPSGRKYYWIIGEVLDGHKDPGTDFKAISLKYASLTPLSLDATDYKFLNELENWNLS